MNRYQGNPKGAPIARFSFGDGFWILAVLGEKDGFINLKLYADDDAPDKANYWISYRPDTKKIPQGKDAKMLSTHKSDLYSKVQKFLEEKYNV
jgi:hypothetical protein